MWRVAELHLQRAFPMQPMFCPLVGEAKPLQNQVNAGTVFTNMHEFLDKFIVRLCAFGKFHELVWYNRAFCTGFVQTKPGCMNLLNT